MSDKVYSVLKVLGADLKETRTGTKYINLALKIKNNQDDIELVRYKKSWLPNEQSAINYLEKKEKECTNQAIEKRIDERLEMVKNELINLGFFGESLVEACNIKYYNKELENITCTVQTNKYTNKEGVEMSSEEVGFINQNKYAELKEERISEIKESIDHNLNTMFKVSMQEERRVPNKADEIAPRKESVNSAEDVPF